MAEAYNLHRNRKYEIDLMKLPYSFINYATNLPPLRITGNPPTTIGLEPTHTTEHYGWFQGIAWKITNRKIISYNAVFDTINQGAGYGNGILIKDVNQLNTNNFDAYGYGIEYSAGYIQNDIKEVLVNVRKQEQYVIAFISGVGTNPSSYSLLLKELKVKVM